MSQRRRSIRTRLGLVLTLGLLTACAAGCVGTPDLDHEPQSTAFGPVAPVFSEDGAANSGFDWVDQVTEAAPRAQLSEDGERVDVVRSESPGCHLLPTTLSFDGVDEIRIGFSFEDEKDLTGPCFADAVTLKTTINLSDPIHVKSPKIFIVDPSGVAILATDFSG